MDSLTDQLRKFLEAHRVGALATAGKHGKPPQSDVYYVRDEERLPISTVSERLEAKDVAAVDRAIVPITVDRATVLTHLGHPMPRHARPR
ncbi:MAG: pyridoxamine 5'-phosphate oxidase family protein [Solirubrobacterales bacterium]